MVNLLKSLVHFSLKTKAQHRQAIQELLGFIEWVEALRYLGVPIMERKLRRSNCLEMEGWQSRALSMMARIMLVRSIL